MNKTAIKNYAIWARVQLIESCKQRAFEYGVTENGNYASNLKTIGSRILTDQEVEQRNQLIGQINQKGYAQVMEEAAYTWFNRFIALRFMEVNGYLPSKVRVFTDENGAFKPEILKEAMTVDLEGIDRAVVIDLLEKQDNEALYKYLLIAQCNALSTGLPYMFEKISNWTELLFPANLLRTDSVVEAMVVDIPEEDWTDAVQIIGWLYQYYNSELKDETFALLKKNVKITKERIPAATQLFTPDWIVRYMVENSLGRLWYEGHKDFDKSQWKYYLDEAEQEPEVEGELVKIRAEYSQIRPEEIKMIDPCMGSGHILVYAFDVLMQIYTSAGWSERDAARSIIENNLYGLDIDDRAGQLAYFAVMMKARKYSRRIMSLDIKPNVMSIQDSSFMTNELIDFVAGNDASIKTDLRQIKEVFTDAKEYGSILKVPSLGYEAILERVDELQNTIVEDIFQIEHRTVAVEQLRPLINQAMIMSQKYDVVVTNPPYMTISNASGKLNEYTRRVYVDSKSDLYAVFIECCARLTRANGYQAMITQHSWMFISTFEKLRKKTQLIDTINMAHLGARAFEEIAGEVVQTTSFVFRKTRIKYYKGAYCRLINGASQAEKEDMFLSKQCLYYTNKENFNLVDGAPIAYWIPASSFSAFGEKTLKDVTTASVGIQTGDNNTFLHLWWEINPESICFSARTVSDSYQKKKWFPYNKGGEFRKWYGNDYTVIDWKNDGENIKNSSLVTGHHYQQYSDALKFKPHVTWSRISTGAPSFRLKDFGFLSDMAGFSLYANMSDLIMIIAFCNSKVASYYLDFLAPTLNIMVGSVLALPFKTNNMNLDTINKVVENNLLLCKDDWDSYEGSWNFKRHPLV